MQNGGMSKMHFFDSFYFIFTKVTRLLIV